MKPQIIKRFGNRFDIDERAILPYLRKHKDYIAAAVRIACEDFKINPGKYQNLDNAGKLKKLNETVYQVLLEWGIWKEK
jgi:hypothetical protein